MHDKWSNTPALLLFILSPSFFFIIHSVWHFTKRKNCAEHHKQRTECWPPPLSSHFRSIVVINQLKLCCLCVCTSVCVFVTNRVYHKKRKLSFKYIHTFIIAKKKHTQAICHIIIFYLCSFNKRNPMLAYIVSGKVGTESDKFNIYVDRKKIWWW